MKINLGKCEKIIVAILVIIIIFGISLVYQNLDNFLKNFYKYKIEQATNNGDFITAEKFYNKQLNLAKDKLSIEFITNDFIEFYINQKLYDDAINLYLKKLDSGIYCPISNCGLFRKEESDKAAAYNEIAFLYFKTGNIKKAEEYLNKAIDSLKNISDKSNLSTSYNLFARLEIVKGNFSKSKEYLNKSNNIIEKQDQRAILDYYQMLIEYYIATKNYKKAKIYAKKLFSLTPATVLSPDLSSELYVQGEYLLTFNKILGNICYKTKEYEEAQRHYEISYNLSNELNGKYYSDTICAKYQLSKIYKQLNKQTLSERYVDEIKAEVKGYKLLKNINNENFEKSLNNFCNI